MIGELAQSAMFALLIVAVPVALAGLAAIGEEITRRPGSPRPRFADPATDRWREDTESFFHPTGRPAARQALLRAGHVPNKEMAPARVASPGATTTHGGRAHEQYC